MSVPSVIAPIGTNLGCKEIPLTQEKFAIVDYDDYERLSKHKWYTAKNKEKFYARRKEHGVVIYLHREVLGITDSKVIIDHINMDGLDNRKSNLRISNHSQNALNTTLRKDNKSGYRGVSYHIKDKKWVASIRTNNIRKHIGEFDSKEIAAMFYDYEAIKAYGDDAYRNFPNPIDVLGIMKRRDDYRLFKTKIGVKYDDGTFMIASEYILEPDALLRTAVKFLEEKR